MSPLFDCFFIESTINHIVTKEKAKGIVYNVLQKRKFRQCLVMTVNVMLIVYGNLNK